jgi:hypothetical protein
MNKKVLLVIAGILLLIGIIKPDIGSLVNRPSKPVVIVDNTDYPAPVSESLRSKSNDVIKALSVDPDRKTDGKRLASLYNDIAALIELDGKDMVVKNTEEVRQANRLSGLLLKLNIKDKYENLAEANQALIVEAIGDDVVLLDAELRAKSVEAFKALAWACNEGSK